MQPPITADRGLTDPDDVEDLIQNAPAVVVSGGLEIVDLGLNVIEDISGDLKGGSITRNSYAVLHASATLAITRELAWGADLVRPYYVISDGARTARFNLGVYHVNTPTWPLHENPPTFDVTGYDMLLRLAQPVGDAYSIAKGANYLAEIENILTSRGYTRYIIDQERAGTVSPSARAWVFDEQITWLTILNDLLAAIGYQGAYQDWDGQIRCEPYVLPIEREAEWTYSDNQYTTMLGTEREIVYDFFDAPNRWVYYRTNLAEGEAPVEGNGIYTYENTSVGDTSVTARNGLVITRMVGVDVADQAALIAQANIGIQADQHIPTLINIKTAVNPLHWHFDRLFLKDGTKIPASDVQCTEWTIQLPPSLEMMDQRWTILVR
jgi:hypothetical protein